MRQSSFKLTLMLGLVSIFFACKILVQKNEATNPNAVEAGFAVSYPDSLKQLHTNVINYLLALPLNDAKVSELLESETVEGTWSDVNYNDTRRGSWQTKQHLEYVQLLARAYQNKSSKYYHVKEVGDKVQLSLNYWLKNDFLSSNWWDQHIGVPELLAPTVILMEPELSKKQIADAIVLMRRAKIFMDGQNKVWLSANVMLRSLILREADSVRLASNAIQGELEFSNGVGLKKDFSYHEHGAQLQFGNYGLSYLEDMIKWNQILSNTPFQFKADKISLLRDYILKGQAWVVFKQNYDLAASGRQLVIGGSAKKYGQFKTAVESMEQVDQAHKDEYENAINSDELVGDKHFYRSDFQVHRTKDFYFSVKMSSKRVVGTESVNEENIKGYYLGDGTSLLYQNGTEYQEVLPFIDWKKLPGTTINQDPAPLPVIKAWDFKTNSTFVGGVDDTKNGVAVMAYDRDGVKAHKSWFMFGNYVVCLGSDINSDSKFPVTTGINTVLLKGKLEISKDDNIGGTKEQNQSVEPNWILHDGLGYLFPAGGNVKLETRINEGSWANISTLYRPIILTEQVLKMWFDHGANPKDKSYAYVLVPNTTSEKMKALNANQPFTISNEKAQQSVIMKDGSLGGIVFYQAGSSNLFGGISVSEPVVLMVTKANGDLEISVSDPSQTLQDVKISLGGKYSAENTAADGQKSVINLAFPQGQDAGKSVLIKLKSN